jgi:hypothetical protein
MAGEDEESGLEGVLRLLLVTQYPATDPEHHWPVPPH